MDWRVFDVNQARGEPSKEPRFPRPPIIKAIWHNAFHDQVSKNAGTIASQIAATTPVLLASQNAALTQVGLALRGIATSVAEALRVSRLIKGDLLNIPLNAIPGNKKTPKLLRAGAFKPFSIGKMTFTIVGPTDKELRQLREDWNDWLREYPARVREIRDEMEDSAERIAASKSKAFKNVTIPNIASLTFMVEEGGATLLLTGDTQHEILMDGLKDAGFLNDGDTLHVDVLKVQHHGAAANLDATFAKRVTADHYVFCGDGAHHNPEVDVLKTIFDARMRDDELPFTFWFSTSPNKKPVTKREIAFGEMADAVAKLKKRSKGRLAVEYNRGDFIDLEF